MTVLYQDASLRTTGIVRQTFRQLNTGLQAFLPNVSVDEIEWEIERVDRTNTAVEFRALDGPGQVVTAPGYAVESGKLLPITAIDVLSESRRHDIRKQIRRGDISANVFNYIEGRAPRVVEPIVNRIEQARGEALSTGQNAINENGQVYTKSWGLPATVNAGVAWATTATSDPIGDLFSLQETARDSGYELRHAIMSSTAISNLLQSTQLIDSVPAVMGTQAQLTPQVMASIIQAHTGLTIHRYDYIVDGTRVIADDIVVCMPDPSTATLGRTEFGVTEEQELLGIDFNGSEPNVVGIVERTTNPVNTQLMVAAIAAPVLVDGAAIHRLDIAP